MATRKVVMRCPVENCPHIHTQEIGGETRRDEAEYVAHIRQVMRDAHPKHEHAFIKPREEKHTPG
jgi:hypothetical protein